MPVGNPFLVIQKAQAAEQRGQRGRSGAAKELHPRRADRDDGHAGGYKIDKLIRIRF